MVGDSAATTLRINMRSGMRRCASRCALPPHLVMTAPLPEPVCLKVAELRKRGVPDLAAYDADVDNARVTRNGRVSIAGRAMYAYRASPWANRFVVGTKAGQYSLEKSLAEYERWLDKQLRDPTKRAEFLQLAAKKTIGCYCAPGARCHRDIILAALQRELEDAPDDDDNDDG
jgi:hypothetical protein